MQFGRVVGSAVCTRKYTGLEGVKLLVVQPVNKHLVPQGSLMVAVDVVQAGPGDVCVMARSREAAMALPEITFVPVDLATIGIVDDLQSLSEAQIDTRLEVGWNHFT